MTEDRAQANWPRCQADPGCAGAALRSWGRCLGHLDPDDLEQAIKRAKTEGLDARGVAVTPPLLERIFSLLDRNDHGAPIVLNARFDRAVFNGDAEFRGAAFNGDASFDEAAFRGDAVFYRAAFNGNARFDTVSLSGKLLFRSVRAAKRLRLTLRDGSTGKVDLAEASFAGPAVVAASLGGAGSPRPKLVSVEQTDTANLTVVGLDLSDCRFLGAINLEQLRIDGPRLLRQAPGWWRFHRLGEAGRRALWEESALRGWPGWETPDPPDGLDPSRLQAVYRELRKGREDAKDEPGAADFYYGEMEMRRKAARGVERWLLAGYWAVSGYELRASRAVLALVTLLAGATVGLRHRQPPPAGLARRHPGRRVHEYLAAAPDCYGTADPLGTIH